MLGLNTAEASEKNQIAVYPLIEDLKTWLDDERITYQNRDYKLNEAAIPLKER
ncbi:hypothetical protein R6U76_11950 [Lysinibacillus capsici]|uniref:hypothetical protein n=1 Tax=Lysinibacillus capsici TaxID=2115968 RepID=UPI0029DE5CCB|nr:hypothetical protein [Lysinibacillus capsici]WPK03401.1 hypothetical protein R6U76_11950 [Lysinibacillus capsici]